MDGAPNSQPGTLPALAAAAVLLAVLAALFFPGFSSDQTLRVGDEFPRGTPAWDSNVGLGEPMPVMPPGSKAAVFALCKLSDNPARVFANLYAPVCLFLLGMAAWFCLRQWNCPVPACLLGALAAALNGVFFTSAVGHFPALAMGGAWAFLALGLVRLQPRLEWPMALLAGLALAMACLEAGPSAGMVLAGGVTLLALGLPAKDASQSPCQRVKAGVLMPLAVAGFVGWGMSLDFFNHLPGEANGGEALRAHELLGTAVAGLTGHRVDVPDSSLQWGSGSLWGMHVGVPALVLAVWALAHALRRASVLDAADRTCVFALSGLTGVAGLLGMQNPLWLALASMGGVLLVGFGARAVDAWFASEAHEKTRAFGSGGFDSAWRLGSIGVLTLAAIAFVIFNGSSVSLAEWLQARQPEFAQDFTRGMAAASTWQAGLAVLFFALTAAAFLVFGMLKWTLRVRVACFGILGVLLVADLGRSGLPFRQYERQYEVGAKTVSSHPVVQHISREPVLGRLALLDDFQLPAAKDTTTESQSLDQWMIEKYLATSETTFPNFENAKVEQVVRAFHQAIGRYMAADRLEALREQIARMMSSAQGPPLEEQMGILSRMPAGQEFLAGEGDRAIINFFRYTINQRLALLRHARALHDAAQLKKFYHSHWAGNEFARSPIVRASAFPSTPGIEVSRARLLRWWELNSVRYFLCVSGNKSIGKTVRSEFPYLPLPIYSNLPNFLVDPSQRRFLNQNDYSLNPETGQMTSATNGPVALMEFTGALPRLQLFADWQSGIEDEQAGELLYQPGFNPHQQVLLSESIDAPAHPSQTGSLPRPKIVKLRADRVELKIPATQFPTVLLFNDAHHPGWIVSRNGKPAPLLRANLQMRAVHLPAAKEGQSVVFQFRSAKTSALPIWVLLGLALLTLTYIWRER